MWIARPIALDQRLVGLLCPRHIGAEIDWRGEARRLQGAAASTKTAFISAAPIEVETGPTRSSLPGRLIVASPGGAPLSSTMSAMSARRGRPWAATFEKASEVIATTVAPTALPINAASTVAVLTPLLDTTISTSFGPIG